MIDAPVSGNPAALSTPEHSAWLRMIQPNRDQGLIALLTVAIDESGSHQHSPVLCIAACVGTSDQWSAFRAAWLPYAKKYEPTGYHATAGVRSGDNAELSRIITDCLPRGGVALRIEYALMRSLVSDELRSRFGSEYAIGIWVAVRFLSAFCDLEEIDWLAYVLEDGHKGRKGTAKAKELFRNARQHDPGSPARYHVYSDTWVGKEEIITHAPDLLSHEWAKSYGRSDTGIIRELRQTGGFLFKDYHEEALREAVTATTEHIRHEKKTKSIAAIMRKRNRKDQ